MRINKSSKNKVHTSRHRRTRAHTHIYTYMHICPYIHHNPTQTHTHARLQYGDVEWCDIHTARARSRGERLCEDIEVGQDGVLCNIIWSPESHARVNKLTKHMFHARAETSFYLYFQKSGSLRFFFLDFFSKIYKKNSQKSQTSGNS